ncbi:MAG: hypothetical protein OXP28_18610 [Gammaproteobacteria bacterium]|nr:hypothetical protein [Gammaproteobacteria bacterium]MDE0453635.1 hypothetical protein [Gammaproteobacteria bacterium]
MRALRRHASHDAARRCIDYLRRNRHRMRYPQFRAMRLCVTSGVVEAGCKHVVGTRFKRPGMHWSVDGVNAMAALRCSVLSNRFNDFWKRQQHRVA